MDKSSTLFLIYAVIKNRELKTQRIYLNTVEMKGAACPEKVYDILIKVKKNDQIAMTLNY